MANVCYGCGKDLSSSKVRFDWLVGRGYDVKDAAARILQDPASAIPPKQCCIVGLQTNIDPDEDLIEREREKERRNAAQEAARVAAGLPAKQREEIIIYASDLTRRVDGTFILKDAPFDDLKLLAPSAADRLQGLDVKGFEITDVGPIPKHVVEQEKWGDAKPLALWSGRTKIIPVYRVGNVTYPGHFWINRAQGDDVRLDTLDKTLLGAEIIEYAVRDQNRQATGWTPFDYFRIRKAYPETLFH